jgi:hypothetical protein
MNDFLYYWIFIFFVDDEMEVDLDLLVRRLKRFGMKGFYWLVVIRKKY